MHRSPTSAMDSAIARPRRRRDRPDGNEIELSRGEKARLAKGVENLNWIASDHTPYQRAGIRTITFNAPISRESVRYYHDFADTIDKVSPQLVADSAASIVDLVRTRANDAELPSYRRSPEETKDLFTRFGLERRMRGMGMWASKNEGREGGRWMKEDVCWTRENQDL